MRIDALQLVGISVHDLDAEVERYSALFGVEFKTFTAGVDYAMISSSLGPDIVTPLPTHVRIAVDTSDCFELIEMPGIPEGYRNIHFRVDDMDNAVAHLTGQGLTVVQDIRAGDAHEVIFDSSEMNGVRVCLLRYDGPSFAAALAASPRPR
jgi:catechol 2,3-dioxygenase-like lactoylglutathione lyase family enzyme